MSSTQLYCNSWFYQEHACKHIVDLYWHSTVLLYIETPRELVSSEGTPLLKNVFPIPLKTNLGKFPPEDVIKMEAVTIKTSLFYPQDIIKIASTPPNTSLSPAIPSRRNYQSSTGA